MLRCVDDLVPIGEFSERSGLSTKRLRSYPAGGLLVPAAIDSASGYGHYFPGQLREANPFRATPALHVRAGRDTSEAEDQTRSTIDLDQGGKSRARIWP
jgi:MerR-like DNA binding protein